MFDSTDQSKAVFIHVLVSGRGYVWVSSAVIGLPSGLTESQLSASVFPSSNCLQKDRASLMSFQITTAAVITVLFVTARRATAIPWLRAPFLWPGRSRETMAAFQHTWTDI